MTHPGQNNSTRKTEIPGNIESIVPAWAYPPDQPFAEEEVNLLDYWRIIKKKKWKILIVVILSTVLAFGVTKLMPVKYKAEVTMMPLVTSGGGTMAGLASQISAMPLVGGALGDIGKLGGGKTKELINILKSRTLNEKIVRQFELLPIIFADQYNQESKTFHEKFLKPIPVIEDGVNVFRKKYSKVEEEKKTGLIKIEILMKDSELAAKIANHMVVELQDFIENNSLTMAKRNRIFLEEQLVKTRGKLIEAGKELNQFYADNKISSVVPQIDVNVGSYQAVPKAFEDFRDEYLTLSEKQKEAEEKKEQSFVRRVPGQVYLQYLQLNRELLARTYGLLLQQYELAKIEEAKEDLAFQVIDKAHVKVRSSSPNLFINMGIGFFGGLFLAFFAVLFRAYIQKMKEKEIIR